MIQDLSKRPLKDLRISVTDRCNFRCAYCMPQESYAWIEKKEILTFEEITRVAKLFVQIGVEKIRLTGGEPLLRNHLENLVAQIAPIPGLKDLCLSTNGFLLAEKVSALRRAGLKRINVSLDTLDPQKFERLTQRNDLSKVLDGLFAGRAAGFSPVKINAVILRGVNDDEILDLVGFARQNGFPIRFIEYMDVGNANDWSSEKLVSKQEMLRIIQSRFPLQEVKLNDPSAPAVEYRFLDGMGELGIIASVTEPFCSGCVRARLTADGKLVTCLFSQNGTDLKQCLRNGSTDEAIKERLRAVWQERKDRYSEERWQAMHSNSYRAQEHKKIEMIRLGG